MQWKPTPRIFCMTSCMNWWERRTLEPSLRVAGSKTKNTNFRCEAVHNIIFPWIHQANPEIAKATEGRYGNVGNNYEFWFWTTQVSDATGKIQWNNTYQDFSVGLHPQGGATKRALLDNPRPIILLQMTDPMEGLMHNFGNLGNNDNKRLIMMVTGTCQSQRSVGDHLPRNKKADKSN